MSWKSFMLSLPPLQAEPEKSMAFGMENKPLNYGFPQMNWAPGLTKPIALTIDLVVSRRNSALSRPTIHSRCIKKELSKELKVITTLAIPTVHPSSLRPVLLGMGLSNPRMKNGSDIYRIEQRTSIM